MRTRVRMISDDGHHASARAIHVVCILTTSHPHPHILTSSHPHNLQDLANGERANYEQNVQDAMAVFPKLQTGLDVNVKFNRYEVYYMGGMRRRGKDEGGE